MQTFKHFILFSTLFILGFGLFYFLTQSRVAPSPKAPSIVNSTPSHLLIKHSSFPTKVTPEDPLEAITLNYNPIAVNPIHVVIGRYHDTFELVNNIPYVLALSCTSGEACEEVKDYISEGVWIEKTGVHCTFKEVWSQSWDNLENLSVKTEEALVLPQAQNRYWEGKCQELPKVLEAYEKENKKLSDSEISNHSSNEEIKNLY